MTELNREEPRLVFFRSQPRDVLSRHPLASSLQHLETSFLLISLWRYPHALVSCASAIESALKAAFNCGQDEKRSFESLLSSAQEKFPRSADFSEEAIKEFRKKRNEIIHYGFSPKDDEISALLLLRTGYRLMEQCYETFFEFPLRKRGGVYGGLLPDIDHHLDIAQRVYVKSSAQGGHDYCSCFAAFAHNIRWGMQHWTMSAWQQNVLNAEDESGWKGWEFRENQKKELIYKSFEAAWSFDCCICGGLEDFVCELDADDLKERKISLKRGICVHCGLVIPGKCPFLADELCGDQPEQDREKILKEYGIT